jgi:hypothetical protein
MGIPRSFFGRSGSLNLIYYLLDEVILVDFDCGKVRDGNRGRYIANCVAVAIRSAA